MLKARERLADMFGILFSILLVVVLLSIAGEIVMRVRLTRIDTSREKLAWWRRGGDEVASTYEEFFPHSFLLLFRRVIFGSVIGVASLLLLLVLRSR